MYEQSWNPGSSKGLFFKPTFSTVMVQRVFGWERQKRQKMRNQTIKNIIILVAHYTCQGIVLDKCHFDTCVLAKCFSSYKKRRDEEEEEEGGGGEKAKHERNKISNIYIFWIYLCIKKPNTSVFWCMVTSHDSCLVPPCEVSKSFNFFFKEFDMKIFP